MCVIGITGEFGSGKSSVAAMFAARGGRVIDADKITHKILASDKNCRAKIADKFGEGVLSSKGVDRTCLGRLVFRDLKKLKDLETILHPLIKVKVQEELKKTRRKVKVLDVPLLIEAGWTGMVDILIVVKANRKQQIQRIHKRLGLSQAEIMRRLKRQMPVKKKLRYADQVIDNRGSLADTDKQVGKIWQRLIKNRVQRGRV